MTYEQTKIRKVCNHCEGSDVYAEASAYWDVGSQCWLLSDGGAYQDNAYCNDCGCDVYLKDIPA